MSWLKSLFKPKRKWPDWMYDDKPSKPREESTEPDSSKAFTRNSCPDCGSDDVRGIFDKRFECNNCGRIFN